MKKGRIILGATAIVAVLASAFAINANASKRANANLYTFTTGQLKKVPCATTTTQPQSCTISVPLYTVAGAQYTGRSITSTL